MRLQALVISALLGLSLAAPATGITQKTKDLLAGIFSTFNEIGAVVKDMENIVSQTGNLMIDNSVRVLGHNSLLLGDALQNLDPKLSKLEDTLGSPLMSGQLKELRSHLVALGRGFKEIGPKFKVLPERMEGFSPEVKDLVKDMSQRIKKAKELEILLLEEFQKGNEKKDTGSFVVY